MTGMVDSMGARNWGVREGGDGVERGEGVDKN
jgi:hypothetical protein